MSESPEPTARPRTTVLLDANALFLPESHGTDLDHEASKLGEAVALAVPSSVLGELDRLVASGAPGARTARALADRFATIPNRGRGDDAILALAVDRGAWVVTADQELTKRLQAAGVTVLTPRASGRLVASRPRRPAVRQRL